MIRQGTGCVVAANIPSEGYRWQEKDEARVGACFFDPRVQGGSVMHDSASLCLTTSSCQWLPVAVSPIGPASLSL